MRKLCTILFLASTISTWVACIKTDLSTFDGVQLSPTLAIPLVKASFAFKDFIKSDSLLQTGTDGTVQIVYAQDNIASYSVADIVNQATGVVVASVGKNIAIGDLSITGFSVQKSTTLSAFGSSFSDPLKTLFTSGGNTPPTGIPAFNQTSSIQSDMADLTEFQNVTLASGTLQLSVQNGFPFALTNQKIDLLDRGNGNALIMTVTVGNIPAGGTVNVPVDLTNKAFSNKLAYRVPIISSSGINANTAVSPSATLSVTATGSSLKVKSGTVKLPNQNLPLEQAIAPITTGNADQKLQEVTIKSATITYNLTKTIASNFNVDLTFPTIKENGVPVKRSIAVNSNTVSSTISINNAVADLSSIAAQPYNQLPVEVSVSVPASSGYIAVKNTDIVGITTSIGNVKIEGAKGQFGNFNVAIPVKTLNFGYDFSFLNKTSQKLLFDNPVVKLRYYNSFGIPVASNISVSANGLLGSNEALNAPAFDLSYPRLNQLGMTIKDSFTISKSNSRVVPFLSILPNSITYSGAVQMKSNNASEVNFFMADSKISLGADFVLPLKFSTENLILRDTIPANFGGQNVDNFESATLQINYNNGFPLKTGIDIIAIKAGISTPVIENVAIPSATVGADGRVAQANSNVQTLNVNKTQLKQLLEAEKLIVVGRIQTASGGLTPVAILTSYSFDVSVGMQAKLKFKG